MSDVIRTVSSEGKVNGLQIGELFAGKFRIERLLGQGGMGAVYLVMHEGLKKRLALKVLLGEIADNAEAVARFMNEAQASANIQSPNVVRVDDVAKTDSGMPYMVMEYLEGQDLSQLLEVKKVLAPEEAVDYVLQALEAVHQAHEARIVHRDLKPSNLFLTRRPDGTAIIKVLDFGISKMQSEQSGALTSTRSMLGSPLYMSPEQLRSSKSVDSRSDIWALGVILYELLTGTLPYVGEGLGELFAAILEQDAPGIRERNPSLDPGLEAVVMKCLRKKKEERWDSVAELAAALLPYAPGNRTGTLALRMTQGLVQPAPIVAAPSNPSLTAALPPMRGQVPSMANQTGSGAASWASSGGIPAKKPIGLIAGLVAGGLLLVGGGAAVAVKAAGGPAPSITASVTSPQVTTAAVVTTTVATVAPAVTTAEIPEPVKPETTASSKTAIPNIRGTGRPVTGTGVKATPTTVAVTPQPVATTKKPNNAGALDGR